MQSCFLPTPDFEYTKVVSVIRDSQGYKCIGAYRIIKTIGKGCHGIIKLCQHIETNELFAAKVYHLFSLFKKRQFQNCYKNGINQLKMVTALDQAYNEVKLMQHLSTRKNPHCVILHDVLIVTNHLKGLITNDLNLTESSFLHDIHSTSKLYLMLDFLQLGAVMIPRTYVPEDMTHTDITDILNPLPTDNDSRQFKTPGYQSLLFTMYTNQHVCFPRKLLPLTPCGYPEDLTKCFINDIAKGLQYLHSPCIQIAHRDIKPDNILIDKYGRARIGNCPHSSMMNCHVYYDLGDFSVASYMDEMTGHVRGTEGTYLFLPPECTTMNNGKNEVDNEQSYKGHNGRSADIWSLGVTLWILLFGTLPFYSSYLEGIFKTISEATLHYPTDLLTELSQDGKHILNGMLAKDPQERFTIDEILNHPWLQHVDYKLANEFANAVAISKNDTKNAL